MPSVSISNFENDELISARSLSFMNNHESSAHSDTNGNVNKYTANANFGAPLSELDAHQGSTPRSSLHRNGSTNSMANLQDRVFNGSPNECNSHSALVPTSSPGLISGSCTPPPPSVLPSTSFSGNFLPMRGHYAGVPPYSALTSPCLGSKSGGSTNLNHMLSYNGAPSGLGECHSLQNSPFYNHSPLNVGLQTQVQRQIGGMSPAPVGNMLSNGVNPLGLSSRGGLYTPENGTFPMRPLNSNSVCPQRELFPPSPVSDQNVASGQNIFGTGLLMQDRLHWYKLAQKQGYIVGAELERVKENSCRSTSQSYGRIAAHFRNRYGETEAKTKAAYLQIGVRVPSKDHVSEIVGKGGQKIKLIREATGALITTPGEHEEHVFIIEAPPEIAMRVAHQLTTRAQEITQSKLAAGERRRGSTSSQMNGLDTSGGGNLLSAGSNCFSGNGVGVCQLGGSQLNSGSGLLLSNGGGPLGPGGSNSGTTSGLLSLGSSATNSPLHPVVGGSLGTSSLLSNTVNNGRGGCSSLFSSHLNSLPNSPCGVGTGFAGHATFLSNGNSNGTMSGTLNNGNTTQTGSRILLARSRISVPQEMVGKIIGTQGSIITTIQKDTGTEIKSPPKEAARGPNATSEFEISAYQGLGLSSNQAAECRVQQAKQLIGHLVMRQLERRASEEIDEVAGCSNLNSDDQRIGAGGTPRSGMCGLANTGNGSSTNTSSGTPGWMWPDVAQMDSQEAREVLDRILAESKNKTRRAKELAAAAAAASPGSSGAIGPSPTSNGPMSALNVVAYGSIQQPSGFGNVSDQSHSLSCGPSGSSHQRFHASGQLLGATVSSLLDSSGPNEASDCTGTHGPDPVNLFNLHIHNPFGSRNAAGSLTLLGEDVSQHGTGSCGGNQMCTSRGLHRFNEPDQNDLLSSFSRAPGPNLGAELWNPLSAFNASESQVISPSMQHLLGPGAQLGSLFSTSASSTAPHQIHGPTVSNSGSDTTNKLGLSSPSGALQHATDFQDTNDINANTNSQASVFNFTDSLGIHLGSSNGDLSPTLLMHYRAQQQHGDLFQHQPLTRRHSDWVVSSVNIFQSDLSGTRPQTAAVNRHTNPSDHRLTQLGLTHRVDPDNPGSPTSAAGQAGFGSVPPHVDLIKAFDQLCLHSNIDPVAALSGTSPAGSSMPHCPPGFEHQSVTNPQVLSSPTLQRQQQPPVSNSDSLYSACSVKPPDADCFMSITSTASNNTHHHATDVWSTTDSSIDPSSPFILTTPTISSTSCNTLNPSDYMSPSGFGKNSLLRRLFPSVSSGSGGFDQSIATNQDEVAKVARLNAIWSQTAHDPIALGTVAGAKETRINRNDVDNGADDDEDNDLAVAFPYLHGHEVNTTNSGVTGGTFLSYPDDSGTGSVSCSENSVGTRCCGAIGDGRRRPRPSSPPSVDQMNGVSVGSSAIASITEVA